MKNAGRRVGDEPAFHLSFFILHSSFLPLVVVPALFGLAVIVSVLMIVGVALE
jgi:hypothetical protein